MVLWDHQGLREALAILVYQDKMERKDPKEGQEIKVLQACLESLAWMECEVQKVTTESQGHRAMMDELADLDQWELQDLRALGAQSGALSAQLGALGAQLGDLEAQVGALGTLGGPAGAVGC